jgi:hypothetical protein
MRLLLFWETCYRDPVTHTVPRQEYIELHLRISKALITPFDYESALKMAVSEWDQDTHGTGIMTEQRFLDAMFSTVDLWTDCVHLECYTWFLDTLYDCLTVPRTPYSRSAIEQMLAAGGRPVTSAGASGSGVAGGAAGGLQGKSKNAANRRSSFDPTASPAGGGADRRWRDLSEIPENPLQVSHLLLLLLQISQVCTYLFFLSASS